MSLQVMPSWQGIAELPCMLGVQYGMGPSQAVCHQVQRVRMYKGDHLVFETSQVMDDIPYGDRFKVEARWDVTSQGPDTCQV